MPELSIIHIGIATAAALLGIVVGWLVRSKLARQEKNAISSGWKEQIESQRVEHGRLTEQNKSLMEQVNQFKASSKDASGRAKELSEALKEAFARRDELQREIKDVRGNLESLHAERKRGESSSGGADEGDKDDKIFRLSRELESWQNRLPPLIDKFRERDADAKRLESDLADAHAKIEDLESRLTFDQTLVEPAATDPEELDASNETIVETLVEPVDETINESVIETTDETVNETLNETMNGTLSETMAETMAERLDGTLAETMAETAIEPEAHVDAASGNGADHGPASDAADNSAVDDSSADDVNGTSTLRDDLQLIKGVGPAIEKTLNELGIFRYGQIAGMSEYDIDRIAKRLKGFRSRIYREDWIGQARELDDQRAGSL